MKRYALWVLVGSVAVSSLLACLALLSPEFGATQGKVLLSTLAIAHASLLAMACGVALEHAATVPLARFGVALAIATAPVLLVATWGDVDDRGFWRALGTLEVLAVTVAHASLLLVATLRAERRWVRVATLLAAAGLAVLLLGLIWEAVDAFDAAWRTIGILAVLATAGTILVWVFHRWDRGAAPAASRRDARPGLRHCVACGSDRVDVRPDGVRCRRCRASFRVEWTAEPTP